MKIFSQKWVTIVMFILILTIPVGLFLMWKYNHWSIRKRQIISVIGIGLFVMSIFNNINQTYLYGEFKSISGVSGYYVVTTVQFSKDGTVSIKQKSRNSDEQPNSFLKDGQKSYESGTYYKQEDRKLYVTGLKWERFNGLWTYENGGFTSPDGDRYTND